MTLSDLADCSIFATDQHTYTLYVGKIPPDQQTVTLSMLRKSAAKLQRKGRQVP